MWPYDFITVAEDYLLAGREQDAIVAFTRPTEFDPNVSSSLAPRLAAALNARAWNGYLDVVLRGKPIQGLAAALLTPEGYCPNTG